MSKNSASSQSRSSASSNFPRAGEEHQYSPSKEKLVVLQDFTTNHDKGTFY